MSDRDPPGRQEVELLFEELLRGSCPRFEPTGGPTDEEERSVRRWLITVIAVLSLVAAACGGEEVAGEAAEASGQGTETEAVAAPASVYQGPCEVVREEGESIDDYIARLYEAAQEEGKAVYYTPANENEVEWFQEYWAEKFPEVELEVVAAPTDTILQRALVEGRSGNVQADGYQGSSSEMVVLEDEGLLEMYRPANEKFVDPTIIFPDRPFINTFALTFHAAYNTNSVDPAELPTDWFGFTEPRWRGEIAMDLNAVEWVAGLIEGLGKEQATELLRGLVANDLRLVEGTTLRTELLSAGEFDVMLDGYGHSLKEFIDAGAPIAVMDPHPEPLTQVVSFMGVMEGAPHPCAALLLAEFVLSKEGQQVYANRNKMGARTEDADIPHPYPSFFGGVTPTTLGPDVNYEEARRVLEEIVVRGG